MHYKPLGPDNFVPPLLHMEMGLVNQVWEDFENWVDGNIEMIPVDEKAAREHVLTDPGMPGASKDARSKSLQNLRQEV